MLFEICPVYGNEINGTRYAAPFTYRFILAVIF